MSGNCSSSVKKSFEVSASLTKAEPELHWYQRWVVQKWWEGQWAGGLAAGTGPVQPAALGVCALGFPAVRLRSCVIRRWSHHSQTWCLLKLLEKHLLWHGGEACLVVKALDFAGFSHISHVTLEHLVYLSVPQFLQPFLSFSFVLEKLQSVWRDVCFLYGNETLTHEERHGGQTPELSCCSQCHLSIVNRVLPWSVLRGDQCVRLFIQHCHSVYTPIPLQISFDHKHWRLMIHSTWKMVVWNFRWDDCCCPWGSVITALVLLCQAAETC